MLFIDLMSSLITQFALKQTCRTYEILSHIEGPACWYGVYGKQSVECQEVLFSFSNSSASSDETSVSSVFFAAFLFSRM